MTAFFFAEFKIDHGALVFLTSVEKRAALLTDELGVGDAVCICALALGVGAVFVAQAVVWISRSDAQRLSFQFDGDARFSMGIFQVKRAGLFV
jgi:hypothetical protein